MDHQDQTSNEQIKFLALGVGIIMLVLDIYFYAHPFLASLGLTVGFVDRTMKSAIQLFTNNMAYKTIAIVLLIASSTMKTYGYTSKSWQYILGLTLAGLVLYYLPVIRIGGSRLCLLYILTTLGGAGIATWGATLAVKLYSKGVNTNNDVDETFQQCDRLIENEYSVNIPTKYKYQGKIHKGYINIVNIFRGTIIYGTPGSGKTFAVYNPIIEQTVAKGFTHVVYDYKFPDLTEKIFNEMRFNVKETPDGREYTNPKMRHLPVPYFYVINFDDARYSNRCNIFNPAYFTDLADVSEVQDILWNNLCPGTKPNEFFSMSAKEYMGICIYFLAHYSDPERGINEGDLCTFPHFVELIAQPFEVVLHMVAKIEEIANKAAPFINANDQGAQDQLQGQLASAQIPLNRMASATLYWVLSGDDFSLDVSNPEDPKTLCIGNNPDRQSIYGTVLALIVARIFRLVNHGKGKNRPCAVLLDEVPTIFLKDVDTVIATARSNKVGVVMGAQDRTQLVRDYTKANADVIINVVGNIISGQVNGETAQTLSRMFGKEERLQRSSTQGENNQSTTTSVHEKELLPASKIETLSQGTFFGKVADNFDQPIREKLFCAQIQIDLKLADQKKKRSCKLPQITSFGEEEIAQNVMSHKGEYIRDYALSRAEQIPGFDEADPEQSESIVDDICEGFSEEEQNEIIKQSIEILDNEHRNDIIMQNYRRIKQDIKDLIEVETRRMEEEEAAGEETDPMDNDYQEED